MAATEYGKFLKKIRIDKDEQLQTMAGNLRVTPSYLSSIESGIRDIPVDFTAKIAEQYNLSKEQKEDLRKLELSIPRKAIQIDFEKNSSTKQQIDIALLFAQKFSSLSNDQIEKIRKVLDEKTKEV